MSTSPQARRWWGLSILGLGVAMIVMDITIINVSLPRIITNLDLELADAEWVNTVYPLVFATLLITLGRVGDLWGRKRLFVAGLTVFAVASLWAGRSDGLFGLVSARAVQGVGAAMVLPATLSMVNVSFRGRDRAIAFGIWGSIIGGMAAVGPLVGGWLTTAFLWRWVFFINVPLALVTVIGAWVLVDDSRAESDEHRGFDIPGCALVTVGLFGLVLALIEGSRYGWWILKRDLVIGSWAAEAGGLSPVPVALVVGLLGLASFVRVQRRRARAGLPVLFDLEMFRLRSFRNGNALVTIVGLGEFGLVFVLPLFLQTVLGYTAFETGLLFVAMAAGGFLGGPTAAVLAVRFGPRLVVTLGMALEALGVLGVLLRLEPTLGGRSLIVWLFLYGAGVGLASAQLTSVVLAEIPTEESGQGSGMQSTFRQVGAALGIALLGTVYAGTLGASTVEGISTIEGLSAGQVERIVEGTVDSAGFYVGALRAWTPDFAPVAAAVETAITDAARRAVTLALIFLLVGLVLSRALPDLASDRGGPSTERRQLLRLMVPQLAVWGGAVATTLAAVGLLIRSGVVFAAGITGVFVALAMLTYAAPSRHRRFSMRVLLGLGAVVLLGIAAASAILAMVEGRGIGDPVFGGSSGWGFMLEVAVLAAPWAVIWLSSRSEVPLEQVRSSVALGNLESTLGELEDEAQGQGTRIEVVRRSAYRIDLRIVEPDGSPTNEMSLRQLPDGRTEVLEIGGSDGWRGPSESSPKDDA